MKTISVLLVDDDRILLDNLASICDWEALGFHIAGKAMNGVQAGNMYKKLRPDLVISDIVMPALDGIGLLKQIMEQDPSAWVILLSSYEDFDYAKQGILYGARDYMLKNEITPETITEKLLLIRSRIAKQQQETALFRANALADLFRHQHNTSTADMLSSTALRSFVYQSFGYVILDIPTRLNAPEEETGPVWDLAKTLSERFPEETAAAIADHQILLLTDPAADASHLERYDRLRRFCEELRQTDCLPAGTVFLLSTTPRDLVDFYRLYTAHMLRKRHFARMDPDTPVRQIEDLHLPDELPAFSFDRKIFRPFEKTGDPEALEAVLQDLQEQIAEAEGLDSFEECAAFLFGCVSDRIYEQTHLRPQFPQAYTYRDYFASLQKLCRDALSRTPQPIRSCSPAVQRAMEYVEAHYAEPDLSIAEIAESVNLSANYLTSLFREEAGMKLKAFVTEVRMQKARQLLLSSLDPVSEIAARVGFSSGQYFSQAFQKHSGLTPKEYRRNNGHEE